MHPGCRGHGAGDGAGPPDAAPDGLEANLNVSSAMLHLAADVMRNVAIMGAAALIELGCVTDVGRADAFCSLAVAALVCLGSVALLQKLVRSSCDGLQLSAAWARALCRGAPAA